MRRTVHLNSAKIDQTRIDRSGNRNLLADHGADVRGRDSRRRHVRVGPGIIATGRWPVRSIGLSRSGGTAASRSLPPLLCKDQRRRQQQDDRQGTEEEMLFSHRFISIGRVAEPGQGVFRAGTTGRLVLRSQKIFVR